MLFSKKHIISVILLSFLSMPFSSIAYNTTIVVEQEPSTGEQIGAAVGGVLGLGLAIWQHKKTQKRAHRHKLEQQELAHQQKLEQMEAEYEHRMREMKNQQLLEQHVNEQSAKTINFNLILLLGSLLTLSLVTIGFLRLKKA